ncbi:MAG: hypothetical protein ACFFDN_32205 [Candidatus Hodarchaeota archaeon]
MNYKFNYLTLIFIVVFLVLSCDKKKSTEPELSYEGITETIVDSLDEYSYIIINEDPDDWKLNFSPKPDFQPYIYNKFGPKISPAFPNPTNDSLKILFSIPVQTPVSFKIIDKNNRFIKILKEDTLEAGSYFLTWHLDDNSCKKVSADIYRCVYFWKKVVLCETQDCLSSMVVEASGHGDIKVE